MAIYHGVLLVTTGNYLWNDILQNYFYNLYFMSIKLDLIVSVNDSW